MNDSIETSEREAVMPAPGTTKLPANKYAAHAAQLTTGLPPAVLEFWIETAKALLNESGARAKNVEARAERDQLRKELAAVKGWEIGVVESAAHGAGGFHVRLANGAEMPSIGAALFTHPQASEPVGINGLTEAETSAGMF